jgi:hypothetical protein
LRIDDGKKQEIVIGKEKEIAEELLQENRSDASPHTDKRSS